MNEVSITIEGLNDEIFEAYVAAGLGRVQEGREALEWAFASNPAPFAVARRDQTIVGISSYIQNRMKLGGATGTAFQAVDSFVSENVRGRGVFTRLARAYDDYATRSGADLIWGFPNENAAPAWFGKLGWYNHGQVPFLIKPLRAGYIGRRIGLPCDFSLTRARDQNLAAVGEVGDWGNDLWACYAARLNVGVVRDRAFLNHRFFQAPQADAYRVVADTDSRSPAFVATREAEKHGGHIAYLMEAMGEASVKPLLMSELGRLKKRGVELVLAWSFPWSPNYRVLRQAGFLPLPVRLRPLQIWFGGKPITEPAQRAASVNNWYVSYLDSDTI